MIVLVAHGTRDPEGPRAIALLARRVRARGVPVAVAYADVRAPDVTTVLDRVRGPAVVVPAFLAAGYHVRTDVPAQIAASRNGDAVLAKPFGPAPELVAAAADRLSQAGHTPGDAVVLAAAGSRDPRALADVGTAARSLAGRLGAPVRVGYAATAEPRITDAVAAVRAGGARVAVASWLLAPGLFQRRLAEAAPDVLAEPIGAHQAVVDLVLRRYAEARALVRA
ncbi:sirohydrochlorin ferrochelatase [Prauserella shujinwangii]|uniref:Sirohydrochlorin ferrochelatase n=1 Tax=Prauserella shujinwangii TaxID=1453103 RepID=A0A2T0LM90_9PSEU|nr:sirohydrochlorin chelatase [Prauserella shujinwangii]PRX44197.1 sirohydrochlorin ferrochelatase [Prauserella shujinwangii]